MKHKGWEPMQDDSYHIDPCFLTLASLFPELQRDTAHQDVSTSARQDIFGQTVQKKKKCVLEQFVSKEKQTVI